jgi:hypothetical protein
MSKVGQQLSFNLRKEKRPHSRCTAQVMHDDSSNG